MLLPIDLTVERHDTAFKSYHLPAVSPIAYVDTTGASAMTACPAGTYSGGGAATCTSCAAGSFNGDEGQSACTLAGSGTYVASTGASAASSCAAGRYAGAGASYCAICPTGTFSARIFL